MTASRVWLSWLAANVLPSIAVSLLLALFAETLGTNASAVVAYVLLFGLVAASQAWVWARWRVTRTGVAVRERRWTAWTVVGLVIAMFFGVGTLVTLDGLGHEHLGLTLGWVVAGLVLGLVQAPLLGVPASNAAWWVVAAIAGWAGTAAVYSPLAPIAAPVAHTPLARWLLGGLALEGNIELAITAATFAGYGVLTGAVMARLTPKAGTRPA